MEGNRITSATNSNQKWRHTGQVEILAAIIDFVSCLLEFGVDLLL